MPFKSETLSDQSFDDGWFLETLGIFVENMKVVVKTTMVLMLMVTVVVMVVMTVAHRGVAAQTASS